MGRKNNNKTTRTTKQNIKRTVNKSITINPQESACWGAEVGFCPQRPEKQERKWVGSLNESGSEKPFNQKEN